MIEKDITINSHGNILSGTLCLPDEQGHFPTVLMVHGTGPLDRDENMEGQQLNIFNTIAYRLADEGIASLRYDKRGCGKSSGDYYTAGHADLINDATNWFDKLQELDSCERVFVLGHSEGTIIAPQVTLRRPTVAGLILICPFVDNMESILMKQAEQLQKECEGAPGIGGWFRRILSGLMGMNVANQSRLIEKLKSTDVETMGFGSQKIAAKSLRELIRLDARTIFSQVTLPMILIGGEKDLQCDPADVGKIAGLVKGTVESHVVKDLTHVLRFDERQASMFGYAELIKKPMEPIILELVTGWVKKQNTQNSMAVK